MPSNSTHTCWLAANLSLVDVGGGIESAANAIANEFPNLKCTVLDLPQVVADLQGTENLIYLGGNMFEAIPPADGVSLKKSNIVILSNLKKKV
ncbi:trans-resveratrol di-o-methyltransferase [Quercus suber]|uniref:Trans-resveratrol di-o-methyltransferase n=1 Tax=Quercus suber TaxID=58331 RepID=A0AAW0JJE1_QUESU